MALQRKTLFGTSYKQISSITEDQGTNATATLFDKIIWMIKKWCNETFATQSTVSGLKIGMSVPNFSDSNKITIVDEKVSGKHDGSSNIIRKSGYTAPNNGWFMLDSSGHDNKSSYLYINGNLWFDQHNDYGRMGTHIFMPVPAGTTIKFAGGCTIHRAYFFPE